MIAKRDERPRTESEILAAATRVIRDRLPATWTVSTDTEVLAGDQRADAFLTLTGPDGSAIDMIVEVKNQVYGREVPRIRDRLAALVAEHPGSVPVLVARYLSAPIREQLTDAGMSFADATGNLSVSAESPVLFLGDRGADYDPWRGPGRPRAGLAGEPAAKIVRTLADLPGPWRIRELVAASGASIGSAYRVLRFLHDRGLVTRDEDGVFTVEDWVALLRSWSLDYQFLATNTVASFIYPRGVSALLDRIRSTEIDGYAVTGSVAAAAWAPHAPARSAMIYATDPDRAAEVWGLRPTESGVNVLLAQPVYPVVLERTTDGLDGLRLAAPTQVAVDLLTGPGRAPAEAEELLSWMGSNERSWR